MNKEMMIALAQGQLDAYNKRDLEAFCKLYHPDIKVFSGPEHEKICDNMPDFIKMYKNRFDGSPNLHCELRSRIVLTDSVIDEEWVTGGGPNPSHVIAVYNFKDNLISRVYFAR